MRWIPISFAEADALVKILTQLSNASFGWPDGTETLRLVKGQWYRAI